MRLLDSALYRHDIEKSLAQIINLSDLKNSRILITGATGLVCSAIVDLLVNADLNITVFAACRNADKVYDRFDESVQFVYYDATKPIAFDVDVDFIIHGASNASPELYVKEPVETMKANINGIEDLLQYSSQHNVKKLIYVSSSEVYGLKQDLEPFEENQYGFIDVLNPRSSYAIAKRAAETMCAAYQKEYGVNFNIVRLGHIYGPSASNKDKRISSDFVFKAIAGKNLVMKSNGKQKRSYVYSLDCATAILSVLTCGKKGEAYNISNKNSIVTIRELAELIAQHGNVELLFDIPDIIEQKCFNPMDNSSLNSDKLENLGWNGIFSADTGIKHTIDIIKLLEK